MELANIYNYQEFHLEPQYPTIGLSYKGWQLISFKQPLKKEEYRYTITLSYKPSFKQRIQELIEPKGRIKQKNLLSFVVYIDFYYLENQKNWFKLCWQAAKAFIDSDKDDFQENGIYIDALETLKPLSIIRFKLQDEIFEIAINDISRVNVYFTKESPFSWRPHYEIELNYGEIIKLEIEQIAEAYPPDFSKIYRYDRGTEVISELAKTCLGKF